MAILDFLSKPLKPTTEDTKFLDWYSKQADKTGINPDPDDPEHYYDYKAAFKAGASPAYDSASGGWKWPSKFKDDLHPDRYIFDKELNIYDSKSGKSATVEDLIIQAMHRKEREAEIW